MPTTEQLRQRLLKKLKELFQLDQPDLDFGFYRIMHAKSAQVTQFLENDLLQIIAETFGATDKAKRETLRLAYEQALETAKKYGAPDPENTEGVQEIRARYEASLNASNAEGEIYDHLYRFFERYYDDGDFISRRYYTRETAGKAAPFAIPYNGEEVKLHWANADQYYIKTSEYFNNFSFDLRQAREVQDFHHQDALGLYEATDTPLRVHFQIVSASEGEHGNVKASEATKRFFILHADDPIAFNEAGELLVRFEYRPDPEKSGQDATWREKRNSEAVNTILAALEKLPQGKEYLHWLKLPAPTEKDKNRPLIAKYLYQYTARNTCDYFIHKDLGGFLRRELDFYIKNEIMHLDDIENADLATVANYLNRIKTLRKIAHQLIDFLAQLENFQKKLWLKKKFVVETNYCITLDRVPEELYPEIAANAAQREAWVNLFAIEEIAGDLLGPAYSEPLTVDFLKANDKLVLDTAFFDENFKTRLLLSIENFDEQCDGLLIHSENFQAINILKSQLHKQIKIIYLDPPYNTSASEIIYKNSYKNSSWLAFIDGRILHADSLMSSDSILCITIDDFEFHRLKVWIDSVYSKENVLGVVIIKNNPSGRSTAKGFSISHEYGIFVAKNENTTIGRLQHSEDQIARYKFTDKVGPFEWVNFRKHGGANANRWARPKLYYPIFASDKSIRFPQVVWNEKQNRWDLSEEPKKEEILIYPITPSGEDKTWKWGIDTAQKNISEFSVKRDRVGDLGIYIKSRLNLSGTLPLTTWDKKIYSSTEYGTNLLKKIFGESEKFSFPKSVFATMDCLRVGNANGRSYVLDFFAGSGTTGHAVISLNREDSGQRKYILVEMGEYFDTVLKPRMQKVVYSNSWKNGKPTSRESGISHCFKYHRLESYEDTLNNLYFPDDPRREKALADNKALREDYLLRYMLDVESRGSQSLLNIDAFADPTSYQLKVKKTGSDEYTLRNVDLLETFNYLIGLRVIHIAAPQIFSASFKRTADPALPDGENTRLEIDGRMQQDENGPWWFRKVEGWLPADRENPENGRREKVLIVWRRLTGDQEQDNLMLDEWFLKNRISTRDFEFETIYVNGSNNLPNLKQAGENWKVRLIEEDFMRLMWDVETV